MPSINNPILPPGLQRPLHLLSSEQLSELLTAIRSRRLRALREYEQAKLLRLEHDNEKLAAAFNKKCSMFVKEFERADKALEKAEKRLAEIMAIKSELEAAEQIIINYRGRIDNDGRLQTTPAEGHQE